MALPLTACAPTTEDQMARADLENVEAAPVSPDIYDKMVRHVDLSVSDLAEMGRARVNEGISSFATSRITQLTMISLPLTLRCC